MFLFLFGLLTVFNVWMLATFVSLVPDTSRNDTGDALSPVQKAVKSAFNVLFFILFPFEILCLIDGFFIEGKRPQVTCHVLETSDLAPEEKVHILHLSDLHLEKIGKKEEFLLKKAGELAPDMILITGDYVNYKSDYDKVKTLLRKLVEIAPCYLVSGNVDCNYLHEVQELKDEFTFLESGVTTVDTGSGIVHLVGCDDSLSQRIPDAVQELENRGKGFRVLLYHRPDLAYDPCISSFDLYLCGHTHGGQVRIPLFGAVITMSELGKAFEMGMYDLGACQTRGASCTHIYVNRGYGFEGGSWTVPKVRFLCRPEIAFFTIKGAH